MQKKLYVSNRNKLALSISISLFITSGLFNFIGGLVNFQVKYLFSLGLDTALILFWLFYINKHIIHTKIRKLMSLSGVLMIMFLMLTLIKNEIVFDLPTIYRYIWYFTYLPMIFIPLLLLYSSLNIGKSWNNQINKLWYLLILVAFILLSFVYTNDYHMLFAKIYDFENNIYGYGFIYYLIVGWNIVLVSSCYVIAYRNSKKANYKRYLFIPFIAASFTSIYMILCFIFSSYPIWVFAEIYCFLVVSLWEGLALIRLIPTNEGYEYLFKNIETPMFIMNKYDDIVYSSKSMLEINMVDILDAKLYPVFLNENIKLSSRKIKGGYSFSITDLTSITEKRKELNEQKENLLELNELLQLDNELKYNNESINSKRELYYEIYNSLADKVDLIESLLNNLKPTDFDFLDKIRISSIINTYIKRYSNLLILASTNEYIQALDLSYCIKESLSYLENYGVGVAFNVDNNKSYPAEFIIELYEAFEYIIERSLPNLKYILVNITDDFELKISVDEPSEIVDGDSLNIFKNVIIETFNEDETVNYRLYVRDGD